MRRIIRALGLIGALYASSAYAGKDQELLAEPLKVLQDCYAVSGNTVCAVDVSTKVSGKKNPVSVRINTQGNIEKTLELANMIQLEIDDEDNEKIPFTGEYIDKKRFKATRVVVKGEVYDF